MKSSIFSLLLSVGLLCQKGYAQQTPIPPQSTPPMYLTINGGFPIRVGASIDLLFGKKNSASLFVESHLTSNSSNTPDDYKCTLCLFSDDIVRNEINTLGLSIGKILVDDNHPKIRLNLKAGIGYSMVRRPVNFRPEKPGFSLSNYTHDWEKSNTVSFILRPVVEFPFTRAFGLGLGMMVNVNAYRSFVAFDINLLLGQLRARTQKL